MHVNNITNAVNREMLREILKKWNMTFDKYLERRSKRIMLSYLEESYERCIKPI